MFTTGNIHPQDLASQLRVAKDIRVSERHNVSACNNRIMKHQDEYAAMQNRRHTLWNPCWALEEKWKKMKQQQRNLEGFKKGVLDIEAEVTRLESKKKTLESISAAKPKSSQSPKPLASQEQITSASASRTQSRMKRKALVDISSTAANKKLKLGTAISADLIKTVCGGLSRKRRVGDEARVESQKKAKRSTEDASKKRPAKPAPSLTKQASTGAGRAQQTTGAAKREGRLLTSLEGACAKRTTKIPPSSAQQASTGNGKGQQVAGVGKQAGKRSLDLDSDDEPEPEAPKKRMKSTPRRDLVNSNVACFFNVSLQLFNQALTNKDVDRLAAGPAPKDFGFVKDTSRCRLDAARRRIAQAAAVDNIDISPDLSEVDDSKEATIDPFKPQQVFAHSTPASDEVRKSMDGSTQEDCHLYTTAILNAVSEEHPQTAQKLHVKRQTQTLCNQQGCKTASTPRETTEPVVRIHVPKEASGELQFDKLLQDVVKTETTTLDDYKCEKCGFTDTSIQSTSFNAFPPNILVHKSWTAFD